MLIRRLQFVQQALVYQRLYFTIRRRQGVGIVFRELYSMQIRRIAICESELIILTKTLSLISSRLCQLLAERKLLRSNQTLVLSASISGLLKDLEVYPELVKLFNGKSNIEELDKLYSKLKRRHQIQILEILDGNRESLEPYSGKILTVFPQISTAEILRWINEVRNVNMEDLSSINHTLEILGEEIHEYKKILADRINKNRSN